MNKRKVFIKLLSAAFIVSMPFVIVSCGDKDKPETSDAIDEAGKIADSKGKFAENMRILGVNVGGMTPNEAGVDLADEVQNFSQTNKITINFSDGSQLMLSGHELGINIDISTTLNNALVLSEDEFVKNQIATTGGYDAPILQTIDAGMMNATLSNATLAYNVEPSEASVSMSDGSGDKFTFVDGTAGKSVDIPTLVSDIQTAVSSGAANVAVNATVVETPPSKTAAQLQENIKKIVTFSTKFTGSESRTQNLILGAEKIDGHTLRPGETFSFNKVVGERSEANGWKEAPAIVGGMRFEDSLGGGICQVSTTLYNGILKADLEIIDRSKHSIPSSYVEHGLDAMVNYGTDDLVFKNNTDYPIYIFMNVSKSEQKISVTVYGRPIPNGEKIILRSKNLSTEEPGEPEIMEDETLSSGKSEWEIKRRSGFTVQAYKEYVSENGSISKTVDLNIDKYRPVNGVKRVGVGSGGSSSSGNSSSVDIPSDNSIEVFEDKNSGNSSNGDDIPVEDDGTSSFDELELPPEGEGEQSFE